jgi:hypothetical protein
MASDALASCIVMLFDAAGLVRGEDGRGRPAAGLSLPMPRHFFGQTRMHRPQVTQAKASMLQEPGSLVTLIAAAGQRLAQAPQWMQEG